MQSLSSNNGCGNCPVTEGLKADIINEHYGLLLLAWLLGHSMDFGLYARKVSLKMSTSQRTPNTVQN